ncbi:uncharacterized protein LOC111409995 isoform X1 [Olea europaea var. sylvestris]|nr:uncharacterized protein LOC111409995 isoform X1 [Olea europaea var. sylvestris]XP_022895911.1 uncharacterized protein LOC111409995 isoform X1 [Olea europaea var. sylvestris]CAA2988116.1 Hypothetical predicted protein [Olea europaea subsp. europaea]
MAKRSQRRLSRHEREQAGCIWSFISILDFRHGRSTRKLIANKRRASRQAVGAGNSITSPTGTCQNADGEESKVAVAHVARISVKELMQEEMFTEQGLKNEANGSEICLNQIDSEHGPVKKSHKRIDRTRKKSSDMDLPKSDAAETLVYNKVPEQKSSDTPEWEIMEEISQIYQKFSSFMKRDSHDDLDMPSDQNFSLEEKLVEAIKVFSDQRLSSSKHFGEEVRTHFSKEFMDALQTLSSNEDLFLKLLQDPNSILVKHMQNLDDTQLEKDQKPSSLIGPGLSKEKLNHSKPDDLLDRKHRKFFHRKSKSLESCPTGGNKNCQSSSKIVILKPGLAGSESPPADIRISTSLLSPDAVKNKVQNERNTSQFSFTEIKRKLRHAMGKEKPGIVPDRLVHKFPSKHQNGNDTDKNASGEIVGWSSPNRDHFYTERFAKSPTGFKSSEQLGKSKVNGAEMANETFNYPRKGVSNIYIEAKKHLSEMLKNGDENAEAGSHRLPKSLGRILSFAEYSDSPSCSPRKCGDDIFITAQTRLSPRGMTNNMNGLVQENHENHPNSSGPNLESHLPIGGDNANEKIQSHNREINIPSKDDHGYSAETQSFTHDVIILKAPNSSSRVVEIEETTGSSTEEGGKHITISRDMASDLITRDVQDSDIEEMTVEESPLQCLKTAPFGDDQALSPSMSPPLSPINRKVKEHDDCEIDKMERPSPISVLEPLFTEDVISPPSTTSQSANEEIQPRQIHFEEQSSASDLGICTRISIEGEETAFEYVEAVLLGSGLNWDDFLLRWLSLSEILDPSLFDEVELFSSRSRLDQKILFDCTNQVLKDICETYFGCFTRMLFVKQKTRPIPIGMNLIDEVWEKVELHLFQHPSLESLDQLIKKDMAKHEKWMYLGPDIEHIGTELGERIFSDLVEDTVMSFATNEFTVLPVEYEAIKDIIDL